MKKLKLLIMLLFCFISIPNVYASSASVNLTGSYVIKAGNTTTIYVKMNGSSTIKGVDLTYSTSGNISVVSASATGGMTEQSRNGNRVLLYSRDGVASGSYVFAIMVKGTKEGTGTVTVSNIQATVGGETAVANNASYTITVKPKYTEAELAAQKEAQKKAEEEARKKKEEEEANQKALDKAKILVEAAEKSLLSDDYEAAKSAVEKLVDSEDKNKLLSRLDEIKFNIAVKEATDKNCNCETKEVKKNDSDGDVVVFLILNIIFALIAFVEFIYIVINRRKRIY